MFSKSFSLSQLVPGLLLILTAHLSAQTRTWTGATNTSWATNSNWSSTPLFNGAEQIVLDNLVRPNQVLGATRAINSLTFKKGGFTISGNALSLDNFWAGLFSTGNNSVNSDISLLTSASFRSESGTLIIGGTLTTVPYGYLALSGAGNFNVTGNLQGNLTFSIDGSGVTTLSGTNTLKGYVSISTGTVKIGSNSAFTKDNTLNFSSSSRLDLNGFDTTAASISGEGSIALGTANLILQGQENGGSFLGPITGSGGLIIALGPDRIQSLTGKNSYSGGTLVRSGFLHYAKDENLGAPTSILTLDGGGIVQPTDGSIERSVVVGNNGASFKSGARATGILPTSISGSGSVTYVGSGIWQARGSYTYTGKTTVKEGAVIISDPSQLGAAGTSVETTRGNLLLRGGLNVTGRSLELGPGDQSSAAYLGSLVGESGDNFWSGAISIAYYATMGCAQGSSFTITGPITGGNSAYGLATIVNGQLFLRGNIDHVGVYQSGSGTLTLSGNNAGSLDMSIGQNTLILQNGNAVSDSAKIEFNDRGTLILEASETIESMVESVYTYLPKQNNINLGPYDLTLVNGGAISGSINGTGRLIKKGTNPLTLAGNNTLSGGIHVQSGRLILASEASLGATNNPVIVESGLLGIITDRFTSTDHFITFTSPDIDFNVEGNGKFIWNQALTQSGSLTVSGRGTFVLAGSHGYRGGTFLSNGVLEISADTSLGAGGTGITFHGGTLRVTGTDLSSISRPLIFQNIYGNAIDVADPANILRIGQPAIGLGQFQKMGRGTLLLTAPSGLTNLSVSEGTFRFGVNNAVASNAAVSLYGTGKLDFQNTDQTFGLLNVEGIVETGEGVLRIGERVEWGGREGIISGRLALVGTNVRFTSFRDYRGPEILEIAAAVEGTGILSLESADELLLSGDNPFSGGIVITRGQLTLTGSLLHTTSAQVDTTGLLKIASGQLNVRGNLVNNGFLCLSDTATIEASGTITNNGIMDVSQWYGSLPANFVNGRGGIILRAENLRISQITKTASGGMQFRIQAKAGITYRLQRKNQLNDKSWNDLEGTSITATTDGPMILTDPNPFQIPQSFYRVSISK